MGDLIASSIRSASIAQSASRGPRNDDPETKAPPASNAVLPSILDAEEVSDPPNLRVTRNPLQERGSTDSLRDGFASMRLSGFRRFQPDPHEVQNFGRSSRQRVLSI